MEGDKTPKFSHEMARAALAKAEAGFHIDRATTRFTPDQMIKIERRVSAVRECVAALGSKPRFS
jgi:hypothetical protein